MPAEDEVLSVMVHVGDTVVESAEKLMMLLLRIAEDMRQRRKEQLLRDGKDPISARAVKAVGDKLTANVAGVGSRGIVNSVVANPDGTNLSYTIADGVLTKRDLDNLSKQFAVRNLQVGVIEDDPSILGKAASRLNRATAGKTDALGQIEFSVRREQVEQFQAALMTIVPDVINDAEKCKVSANGPAESAQDQEAGEQSHAPAQKPGKSPKVAEAPDVLDAAHVLDGRGDLSALAGALNEQGIKVATSRDREGRVEFSLIAPKDPDVFASRLADAAKSVGVTECPKPIERDEDGRYPDKFSLAGYDFERKHPHEDVWSAKSPEDERNMVEVSLLRDGSSRYEIKRNGEVLKASPAGDEVKILKDQPLEDAAYKAASCVDRLGRTDERKAAEAYTAARGKALSGSESRSGKSGAGSETAHESREKAKQVARDLSKHGESFAPKPNHDAKNDTIRRS